jgi:molybdate transport system ATP-binding protein
MSLIAAVIYGPDDDCDHLLTDIAHDWMASGLRVAGLVQINAGASCDEIDMELEALDTGRRIGICQDLGSGSANACRLDPRGLAEAAGALRAALDKPVDVVVINKFGRMEAEGAGLIAEIGATVEAGLPLVIGVPRRFAAAWDAFAGGLDVKIACERDAIDAWRKGARALLSADRELPASA